MTNKEYDYLLKVLLVGDSDVGKHEILSILDDGSSEGHHFCSGSAAHKTTTILLDGKRVKLQVWDTSGQGRFCTIIRSYSRGAQGVILVYDITNKWSFDGIERWLKEVEDHAPGVPKVLVGNRLHLAFKRQVAAKQAEMYASKHKMACFEISPLCDFNIRESFCELARMALHRNGMERIWRSNKGKKLTIILKIQQKLIKLTKILKLSLVQCYHFRSSVVGQFVEEQAFMRSINSHYHLR